MWTTATIHAYDVMGKVFVTASVRTAPGESERGECLELHATATLDGVGETTPRDWLVDALTGLLETL
jgi:hypothetical protein